MQEDEFRERLKECLAPGEEVTPLLLDTTYVHFVPDFSPAALQALLGPGYEIEPLELNGKTGSIVEVHDVEKYKELAARFPRVPADPE